MPRQPTRTFSRGDLLHYTLLMDRVAVERTYMDMNKYNTARYRDHLRKLTGIIQTELDRLRRET